jgi:uncharacterized protein YsxB (DUF464 family)
MGHADFATSGRKAVVAAVAMMMMMAVAETPATPSQD